MLTKPLNRNTQIPFMVLSLMRQQPRKFPVLASNIETAVSMVKSSYPDENIVSVQLIEADTVLMNSDDLLSVATEAGPERIIKGN